MILLMAIYFIAIKSGQINGHEICLHMFSWYVLMAMKYTCFNFNGLIMPITCWMSGINEMPFNDFFWCVFFFFFFYFLVLFPH